MGEPKREGSIMPTAVEHAIIAVLKPFERGTDLSLDITGLHLPDAVNVDHQHTNEALSLNFTLTGDALHLDINLLVPAVHPTDFLLV
jgi:hypothetical protein